MRKTSILVYLLFFFPFLFSQTTLSDFNWLKSEGEIPTDFRKGMENPTDMSQLTLNHFFNRGEVIYGSVVNEYLDHIIDNLLVDYPELRKEIRCYLVRSAEVNAFAMSSGAICVNIGLIAQANNESEIAFVLAHEISHYAKKHIHQQNEYKKEKIDNEIDAFLKFHTYSREIEMEADRHAIEKYFSKSAYSYDALEGVFDMLQYSYLPFDEMPFNRSFVEEPFYSFPDNYFLENLNPIQSRDDYVDTLSTHPNIKRRRENVESLIRNFDNSGRKLFVQSEDKFKEIRELCRFECINAFLMEHEYDNALYNIYFLLKNNPNNEFLETALGTAYYGLCMHKLQSDYTNVMPNHRKIEGEKQQLNYLFAKLTRQELNVLALRNLWLIHKKYSNNELIEGMLEDVAGELFERNKMKYADFSDYAQNINPEDIKVEEKTVDTTATSSASNRYQQIRKSTRAKVVPTEKFKTLNYMLVDLKADNDFVYFMDNLEKKKEDEQVLKSLEKATSKSKSKSGNGAGINELVVVNPVYWRSGNYAQNSEDEKIEKHLKKVDNDRQMIDNTMKYSLKKLKFDYRYFSMDDIAKFDTKSYNTYTLLRQWQLEYISAGKTEMRLYECRHSQLLIDEIGYSKAAFVYVFTAPAKFLTYDKFEKMIAYSLLQYTALPMTLFNFLLPNYQTYVAVNIADLRNGKTIKANNTTQTGDMMKSFINYYIYDSFYNLKKGK